MLFVNLDYQEGFGLPSAEAMASACTVIGYHGMGGKEFYRPEFFSQLKREIFLWFFCVFSVFQRPCADDM
jgi:hypothetical protein